ncbi:MAG: hypothetical protein EBS51_09085 [Planctomycetia bacterium]|nr:hypothetical protein [Planctomycetia bacterium]
MIGGPASEERLGWEVTKVATARHHAALAPRKAAHARLPATDARRVEQVEQLGGTDLPPAGRTLANRPELPGSLDGRTGGHPARATQA